MSVSYWKPLETGPDLPPAPDEYVLDEWEAWHDEYVTALGKRDGVTYLKLTDEVPDDAVLIDRNGITVTKAWDGSDEWTEHDPESWTWLRHERRIEGWDPERFIILGPGLSLEFWHELVDEETMPLRIATEEEAASVRIRWVTRDASCGPGGVARGNKVICGSYGEARQFVKNHWKGKES